MNVVDNLEIMSIEEVADVLHCGKNTVYNLLNCGELKGFRISKGPWKIPRTSLAAYLEKQTGIPFICKNEDAWKY